MHHACFYEPHEILDSNLTWTHAKTGQKLDWARASWIGDTGALQLFVADGGDVNAADEKGATPLGFTCGYGRSAATEMLLKAKAHPDSACSKGGELPLHRAARFGQTACVRFVLF